MRKQKKFSAAEISELTALVEHAPGHLLTPAMVLERAKHRTSALHDWFTWDDGEAAERWRLHEARELITCVTIEMPIGDKQHEVRMFVSLGADRVNAGGYRALASVLSDAEMRQEMLRTAVAELGALRLRYEHLEELVRVWKETRAVERRVRGKRRPADGPPELTK